LRFGKGRGAFGECCGSGWLAELMGRRGCLELSDAITEIGVVGVETDKCGASVCGRFVGRIGKEDSSERRVRARVRGVCELSGAVGGGESRSRPVCGEGVDGRDGIGRGCGDAGPDAVAFGLGGSGAMKMIDKSQGQWWSDGGGGGGEMRTVWHGHAQQGRSGIRRAGHTHTLNDPRTPTHANRPETCSWRVTPFRREKRHR
jgi:hypothetical protein